jgi:two-component system, sensor histidine kinase ChiS
MSPIGAILLVIITGIISHPLPAGEIPIHFVRYTTDDGLPHNTIRAIAQDNTGFMWFGTEDGLVRFDGNVFRTFRHDRTNPQTVSNNTITSLYVGNGNILWVGTLDGLNRLDLHTQSFMTFRNNPADPFSISHNYILSIYEDTSGIVWIGTSGGGLNKYDPSLGTLIQYKRDPSDTISIGHNYITCITEDNKGMLWLGTAGRGIIRFDRSINSFMTYEFQPGVPESFRSNVVRSITQDASGLLWVGTYYGFHLFDPELGYVRHWSREESAANSLPENSVWSIKEDADRMLWIATFGGGLNRFNPRTGEFDYWIYSHESTLANNSLYTLFFDNAGTLWIGTAQGISKINNALKQFATYSHNPRDQNTFASSLVSAVFEDSAGVLWVGAGGLNKFDRKRNTVTRYTAKADDPLRISHGRITTIQQESTGKLLIGTEGGGLNRFDPDRGTFKHYRQDFYDPKKLSHDAIWTSCIDHRGNLWIGTAGGGLNKFDTVSETFTRWLADDGNIHTLANNFITSILEDRNAFLWIGTEGGGLHRFDPQTEKFTRYPSGPEISHGVSSYFISGLYQDLTGVLWVGTRGEGLSKCIPYDTVRPDSIRCFTYREKDGLSGDVVQGILGDDLGNLWISTNKGISNFNPHNNTFRNYDRFDGLQGSEFSRGACFKNKEGELIFGGFYGMNIFHPDSIKENIIPPPVVITGLRILNEPVDIGDHSFLPRVPWETDCVTIPYDRSMITFEFAALDYRWPGKNQYAYKLEGFNDDWISCGNERTATFTNLNPGTYTFRVKGSNNDGIWNEEGAAMKLMIQPPYWKTWWFRSGALSLLAGILLFGFYSRINRYKKARIQQQEFSKRLIESQEQERKRIASELHDGLAQNLLLINYEVMKNIKADESETPSLKQALTYIQEAVEEVREIAYNLHPHQLERLGLTKALESAALRIASASGLQMNIQLENIDSHIPLRDQIHLYRIIQEAFTNIVKHAGATACEFKIRVDDGSIRIRLADDGRGFTYGKHEQAMMHTKGFGLSDMEERVKLIGGTIHIDTAPDRGTIFECSIHTGNS